MRIFISWSGQESKAVATAVERWLKLVIPSPDIFLSSASLDPGVRWGGELGRSLQETNYGIICLTPTNLEAPWVLFEAGAISKVVQDSRVTPLLHRVSRANVTGPLAMFQMIETTKVEFKGLAESINELSESPKDRQTLDQIFELAWPGLEQEISEIVSEEVHSHERERPERELIEEILALVRGITTSDRRDSRTRAQEEYDRDLRLRHRAQSLDPDVSTSRDMMRVFNEWLEGQLDTPFELHGGDSPRKLTVYFGPDSLPAPSVQMRIIDQARKLGLFVRFSNENGDVSNELQRDAL